MTHPVAMSSIAVLQKTPDSEGEDLWPEAEAYALKISDSEAIINPFNSGFAEVTGK